MLRLALTFGLLVFLLVIAGTAEAHRQGLRAGYTRLAYDCSHDYGWESGHPEDLGHELVTIDVIERTVEGRPLLVFELNLVQAMSVVGQRPGYETRETLSFVGPRGTWSTTFRSTDETSFQVVDGFAPAYVGPRKAGLTGTDWDATAEDEALIAVDVGYAYSDLQIENGDHIRDASLVGHYETFAGWRRGDVLPGGTTAPDGRDELPCRNGHHEPEEDETWYVAPSFVVERSDWTRGSTSYPPSARFTFTPASPKVGDVIGFQDASVDRDGDVAIWFWDFGDGSTSRERNASHAYSTPGNRTVRLTVTDAGGASSTAERTLVIARPEALNLPPRAAFSWTPRDPRAGDPVVFHDESADPDGYVASREWVFEEQGRSNVSEPTRRFAPGAWNVTLTVFDDDGASVSVSQTVTAQNRPPVLGVEIAPQPARVGAPVVFHDRSHDPDAMLFPAPRPLVVTWIFPDATVSGARVERAFEQAGRIGFQQRVQDADGAESSQWLHVEILAEAPPPAPSAAFAASASRVNVSEPVSFLRLADHGAARWDFGDGYTAAGNGAEHAFSRAGEFWIQLTVSDVATGSRNASSVLIHVVDRPPAGDFAAVPPDPLRGASVRFRDEARDPEGAPLRYEWDFGDGTTSIAAAPSKVYAQAGEYVVARTAIDAAGGSVLSKLTLRVRERANAPPLVAFESPAEPVEIGGAAILRADVHDPDGDAVSRWEWSVEGDVFAVASTASFVPKRPGAVFVTLRAWDEAGAAGEATRRIVASAPTLAPIIVASAPDDEGRIRLSVEARGEIVSWEWHFTDGTVEHGNATWRSGEAEKVRVVVTDRAGQVATAEAAVGAPGGGAEAPRLVVPWAGGFAALAGLAIAARRRVRP